MDEKTIFNFKVEDFAGVGHDDDECPICKCKDVVITIRGDVHSTEFKFGCGHTFLYKSGEIHFWSTIDGGDIIG